MIKNLEIKNFKSIKHLKINCKRINLFIGEPNTGKSNILETLGIISAGMYASGNVKNFVRFEFTSNLFYDENIDEDILIKAGEIILSIVFKQRNFKGTCYIRNTEIFSFICDYKNCNFSRSDLEIPFKFYRFAVKNDFPREEPDFLLPPSGENLLTVLRTHKELCSIIKKQIFEPFGLKLVFKTSENKIEVLKETEGIFVSYPYSLVSDTLQRIVFYLTAISSNRNSILIFEEPEAHAFPYYTKYLAERIALDKNNNQYFISTHNPYLLLSILEKAKKEDVAVFITYFKDYQTKVKSLSGRELEEVMELGIDIFFDIEKFLESQE